MDSKNSQNQAVHSAAERFGLLASYVLIVAGCLVFAGWQFRIPILRGQVFGSFVAPNAALSFLFAGLSIIFQLSARKFVARTGVILGAAVAVFAFLIFIEHVTHVDLHIDRLFFAHRLDDWWLPTPGRFAITTSIALMVGGAGLVYLRKKGKIPFADIAGCVALGVAYVGIIGYVFGFHLFYGRVMAIPTAALCAIFGLALLCANASGRVVNTLASPRLGGMLVRRLTGAIFLLFPVLAG